MGHVAFHPSERASTECAELVNANSAASLPLELVALYEDVGRVVQQQGIDHDTDLERKTKECTGGNGHLK